MATLDITAFPNYLQMRQPLPIWVWRVLSVAMIAGAFALIALLFVEPRIGLNAWWRFVLPVLPLLWVVAPGIWRNVCPMAALNQYPRLFGFSRGLTVPAWLRSKAFLIQCVLYFGLISLRAPLFNKNGPAVAVLMLVALGAAFLGGVAFKGKSGWCGTFCPLMPIQRLYGQTPLVVVPNAQCRPCVGCTKNCYDFNPRIAAIAEAHDDDPRYFSQRKVFAGALPGFVVAFFTVPASQVGAAASLGMPHVHYYAEMGAYMLVSLGLFFLIEALVPLSTVMLVAVFGALALNLHNALAFPTAFNVDKPPWLFLFEGTVVATITVVFLVRTRRNEIAVTALARAPAAGLGVRPGAGLETAIAGAGTGPEVEFQPSGPRVVAVAGTSLLDVAEQAELPLEVGCRMGVCGADPVVVLAGMEHLSELGADERATLDRLGLGEGCRMACCARVSGPVTVSLDTSAAPRAEPISIPIDYDRSVGSVVVIGNGIAGVTAADHVRRRHPDCTIDVIADELHPLYNRIGVSRLIYGRSAMTGLHLLPDDWYDRNRITCWLNTQVHEIDLEGHTVILGTEERLAYDRLILTMGGSASLPSIDGLEQDGVFVVRGADDAISLRAYAQRHRCRRAIVAGGGLLGLEAAYAMYKLGLRVTVVQRSSRLLTRQLDDRASELLKRYFNGLGIEIVLEAAPVTVEGDGHARAVVLSDGRTLDLDLLVVCAGIHPNTELAAAAGIEVGRGVIVDEHMRTNDPNVFAAGDVAEFAGEGHGLWTAAVAQAEIAGANVAGDPLEYEAKAPVALLKGVGLPVMSIGAVDAEDGDEEIASELSETEIRYRKLVIRDGRLLGAVFVGLWPETSAVVAAVEENLDVAGQLEEIRAGDWSRVAPA